VKVLTALVLANGRIYCRNSRGEVAVVDVMMRQTRRHFLKTSVNATLAFKAMPLLAAELGGNIAGSRLAGGARISSRNRWRAVASASSLL
jgi:hypothetical protein